MKAFLCIAVLAVAVASAAAESDFAVEVVLARTHGPFGLSPYDDPLAALGKPTTMVDENSVFVDPGPMVPSLAYSAWNTAPGGGKLITTLGTGAAIVVKFDHKVVDHPDNWYGLDLQVFGNAAFTGNGFVDAETNMETHTLANGHVSGEMVTVSVSSDGVQWYTYANGPYADGRFPTNPFAWDRQTHTWGDEMDWTKPVNPALTAADFAGKTAADAIDLYDGSAGGTGFDLSEATGLDTVAVTLSGGAEVQLAYIQYVKVVGDYAEVDGFSDVAPAPTAMLPGDANGDGFVDDGDLSLLLAHWGRETDWAGGEFSGSSPVDDSDLSLLLANWTGSPAMMTGQTVPEPATAALLACGVLAALRSRRR